MIYVGIDIAKLTHFASVMSSDGEILVQPFSFSNDISGFNKFLSVINSFDKDNLLIGLESTAHYAENIISFLFNLGFKVAVINPIQTASLRRSAIRKTKTDKVDTFIIIKALSLNNYNLIRSRDISIIKLKSLCRARQNLMTLRSKAKIQLVTYVDQIFPELNYFFKSGLHINVSYQLLKKHSSPAEIKSLHLTYLSNLLSNASRGKYSKPQAISLRELASNSVGITNSILSLQISNAIELIELYTKQIDSIEASIVSVMKDVNSRILSIPGMGHIFAAIILAHIGDISRFSYPSQIIAYAGIDPSVVQSGNFTARTTRMSKRGAGLFRYALIYSAHNIVLNNETFKKYYDLKRAQGKSHYNALGHVASKLVRVMFKLITCDVDFNLD